MGQHPNFCAFKKDCRPLIPNPTQIIEPPRETKPDAGVCDLYVTVLFTNFARVLPLQITVSIVFCHAGILYTKLTGNSTHNNCGDIKGIIQKSPKVADCSQLQSKSQSCAIVSFFVDIEKVCFIKIKISREVVV
jgi:hypothetical protein